MQPRLRSLTGAVLALLMLPVILATLACLPVPIGNPERSRIDPDITGIWMFPGDGDPVFYTFEPWDKRTWLLTGVPLEEGEGADFNDYDLDTFTGLSQLMETETVGAGGATATEVVMYKVWMTKLGGVWFLTWEPKGLFDDEQFAPETWYVFRVDKTDANTLSLYLISGENLFPDDLEKTRRAYERVIRKNAKNPELYDEDPMIFTRLPDRHRPFFAKLAAEVVADSD